MSKVSIWHKIKFIVILYEARDKKIITKNLDSVQILNLQNFAFCVGSATIRVDQEPKILEEFIKIENISFCFTAECKLLFLIQQSVELNLLNYNSQLVQ